MARSLETFVVPVDGRSIRLLILSEHDPELPSDAHLQSRTTCPSELIVCIPSMVCGLASSHVCSLARKKYLVDLMCSCRSVHVIEVV